MKSFNLKSLLKRFVSWFQVMSSVSQWWKCSVDRLEANLNTSELYGPPFKQTAIYRVETIEKMFTSKIKGMEHMNNQERTWTIYYRKRERKKYDNICFSVGRSN